MAITLDKTRRIISPTLVPEPPRAADAFERQQKGDAVLTIGLVNNMPDSALQATERQFTRLLQAAAGKNRVHLHCFSLPSVERSSRAKALMDGRYADIADLGRLHIDGLIVTGAEPIASTLPEEPFWQDLTAVIDWAANNTR
jgi:homoserine O-succinyltransferase/O-acetyltransferase